MGKIHKIGEEYYIEFYARGLLYQQKAGSELKKAQELLASIEEKIAQGESLTMVRTIELDIFLSNFLQDAAGQFHPATVRRLRFLSQHFLDFIKKSYPEISLLSMVTPRVIEEYKSYMNTSRQVQADQVNPKTINLTLLLLREIFEYGIKTGYINDNPTLHVRLLKVHASPLVTITDEQFKSLIDKLQETYQDMFIFMRFTGLRPAELLDLTWQKVDLNRNVVFIRLREVPLMTRARGILEKLSTSVIDYKARVFLGTSGDLVSEAMLKEAFENARYLSGMSEDLSMIHLRRSFIIALLRRRVSFLLIAKITGIADVAKLMLYSEHIPIEPPAEEK